MKDLQNPHTVAYYAAVYEAEQADRDFGEAYRALQATGFHRGGPEDYATWSVGGYVRHAQRLVRRLPVWEA